MRLKLMLILSAYCVGKTLNNSTPQEEFFGILFGVNCALQH